MFWLWNCTEWPLKMCVRKFCMHYILNEFFKLYIERLVAPLNKSAPFSPSTLVPAQQNWCFDYENNNCTEWPLKMCVRKFCMHYILNENFLLNISRVISKSVRRELTFWLNVHCIKTIKLYIFRVTTSHFSSVCALFHHAVYTDRLHKLHWGKLEVRT